ncbi:MAG: hypothetical protein ABEJ47_01295 [Halorhabdus sp.]
MTDRSWAERILRHPVTAVSAGVLAVIHGLHGLGVIANVLGATAGLWFPLLGVLHTLGTLVSVIPAGLTTPLFVAGAIVYGLYLMDSLWDRLANRLKQKLP